MKAFAVRKKLKGHLLPALSVGACLGAAALVVMAVAAHEAAAVQPVVAAPNVTVEVVTPVRATFARTLAAGGSIRPRDELIVGSDAAGVRLLEVLVDVGSHVEKGQLLARADDAQLQAQLAQQRALIERAEAERELARANLDRAEALEASGVYSLEVLQTRRAAAETADAQHALARAQYQEFEVKLAQTRVLAPADGIIANRTATVGAVLQPGMELFRVIRGGELEWHAELPAAAISQVSKDARARLRLEDGTELEAPVRLVAPTLDVNTRNGLVYVSLPVDAPLKAGSHAQGEIVLASVDVLALPEESLVLRDGHAFVYSLDARQVAHLVKVETGQHRHGLVEVKAGLDAGTRVIGTGAGFVKNGEIVGIAPASVPLAVQ
jgi:HlyD family secretion protein